jgi:RNA polymerase sigma-70 factor (ECF subfamily)
VTATEFTDVVDETYEAVYRFAYSLSRDAHDAADLTQQAFFTLAEKSHQLKERAKAKSWLFTTLYRDFLKQRRRASKVSYVEDTEPYGPAAVASDGQDAARQLDGASVVEALGLLDEVYRAPLTLFYLQQASYKEIARILGVPIGTVMSRLARGKEQLRKLLAARPATGPNVVPFPHAAAGARSGAGPSSNAMAKPNA